MKVDLTSRVKWQIQDAGKHRFARTDVSHGVHIAAAVRLSRRESQTIATQPVLNRNACTPLAPHLVVETGRAGIEELPFVLTAALAARFGSEGCTSWRLEQRQFFL